MTVIKSLETAKSFLISFEKDVMAGPPVGTNEVIFVRVLVMEVKDKHKLTSLKND